MKTFIVLFAVVAVASASAISRSSGWGAPVKPVIDLELNAAAAAAGLGQASAGQALIENAIGNIEGPAYIQSLSGVLSSVNQAEEISQIEVADKPSGATSTINNVAVENQAIGTDTLEGNLGGAIEANVVNAAQSESSGEGSEAAEASSLNHVVEKKN